MKTISPVTVWYNGQEVEATVLGATCMNDNLQNSASFQYQLFKVSEDPIPTPAPVLGLVTLVTSGLTMTGDAYLNWDSNDYAYSWIAEQLNLTITGEYVPPTPIPPTPATEG